MKINLLNILHSLIVWQSLLFAVVLFTPKFRTRHSNIYLGLLLLTIGVHFSYNILYTNNLFSSILSSFSCSYGFLYGPLLFLYTKFYLFSDLKFKGKHWIHFSPFVLIVLATFAGYPLCNNLGIPLIVVMLIYCILSYNLILSYESGVVQVYSTSEPSQTRWIKVILIIMLIILVGNIIHFSHVSFIFIGFTIKTETIVQFGILALINLILYQGLKSPTTFQKISTQDIAIGKAISNPIDKEELKILEGFAKQIDLLVSEQQLYLDSDLTIRQLAEETGIHEKSISRAINTILKSNFSEYINSYRINKSISLINSEENLSIKEVMFMSGFNSRSVFNASFKHKTGSTPSIYRKENQVSRLDS